MVKKLTIVQAFWFAWIFYHKIHIPFSQSCSPCPKMLTRFSGIRINPFLSRLCNRNNRNIKSLNRFLSGYLNRLLVNLLNRFLDSFLNGLLVGFLNGGHLTWYYYLNRRSYILLVM